MKYAGLKRGVWYSVKGILSCFITKNEVFYFPSCAKSLYLLISTFRHENALKLGRPPFKAAKMRVLRTYLFTQCEGIFENKTSLSEYIRDFI